MEAWLELSEKQVKELEYRKLQLEETIEELNNLRNQTKANFTK